MNRLGGGQPSVLQQVTVQIIANEVCKANYGSDAPGGIVDHMICAAYPGKDSCSVCDLIYMIGSFIRILY